MDYEDYKKLGGDNRHFYFRGKINLIKFLLNNVSLPEQYNIGSKILNIGAGTGDDVNILKQYGVVYILDKNELALNLITDNKVKKIISSIENYKSNERFDIVLLLDVLEHIKDDKAVIKKITHLLNEK